MTDKQRSINLNVLSSIPAVTQRVHEKFLDYTRELCDLDMDYINVSITKIGDDIEVEEETQELVDDESAVTKFQDILGGWVQPGASMQDILEELYDAGVVLKDRG